MKTQPKTVLTVVAALVVIIVGGLWYQRSVTIPTDTTSKSVIVDAVDRGMSPEQRANFEARITTLSAEIETERQEGKRDISKILDLGNLYYTIGELAKANEQYQEILRTNPTDTPAMENMGQSLMEMGDYEAAADLWVKSLNIVANEAIYLKLVDLIDEHIPAREHRIQDILETAIGNLGQTPSLLKRLAQWYGEQKKYPEAISHYEVAKRLAPDDTSIQEAIDQLRLEQSQAELQEQK